MTENRFETRAKPAIIALASLMVASRINGIGLGLRQLSTITPEIARYEPDSKKIVKKAYKLTRRYMETYRIQSGIPGYENYVRIASKILGLQGEFLRSAGEMAKLFGDRYGRKIKPMAVAGAAIYVSLRKAGGPRMTLSLICEKLNITEPTLRNAIRLMSTIA